MVVEGYEEGDLHSSLGLGKVKGMCLLKDVKRVTYTVPWGWGKQWACCC